MKAEFEEKVYESWFNSELAKIYPIYFPPGQVCENSLGFDAAFSINTSVFRNYSLAKVYWDLRLLFRNINELPGIKVNCFFQYKRPDYVTNANGGEWNAWEKPYYRYEVSLHQQQILENLNRRLNNKALILYAAPVTIKIRELFDFHLNSRIIQNSNFTEVNKLTNHHVNTYIANGSFNKAFSEPEEFKSINFYEYFYSKSDFEQTNFIENTIYIANTIKDIMFEDEIFGFIFQDIINKHEQYIESIFLSDRIYSYEHIQLIKSLHIMQQFKLLTGIQWCCTYQAA